MALECQLVAEVRITKVEWLKDGKPVPADGPVTDQTEDNRLRLNIHKAVAEDVGVYAVKVPGYLDKSEACS